MNTYVHLWWYLTEFFWEWEIFHRYFVKEIKKHVLYSIFYVNSVIYEMMWKNIVEPKRLQLTT